HAGCGSLPEDRCGRKLMPFIPHTRHDLEVMLEKIGVPSLSVLFDEIPKELTAGELGRIPPAVSEMEITRLLQDRAQRDGTYLNFIGAGAYDHHIPAAVWQIVGRGE